MTTLQTGKMSPGGLDSSQLPNRNQFQKLLKNVHKSEINQMGRDVPGDMPVPTQNYQVPVQSEGEPVYEDSDEAVVEDHLIRKVKNLHMGPKIHSGTKINYSEEQKAIALAVREEKNVIVDAVAGSGKTTTIACIAETNSDKRILAVLYNRALADESSNRIGRDNIEIRTIHGAAASFYKVPCMDDRGLQNIIDSNTPYTSEYFDVIIVDEAQDLTRILVLIIKKIIRDSHATKLVFLGDYRQCIYLFNEADERFLTMADTFFSPLVSGPWVRLTLSETYRCNKLISKFVNDIMLGEKRLISNKLGQIKPQYLVCNAFEIAPDIDRMIDKFVATGARLEDVAILGFSINSPKSPIAKIANYLSSKGKPIFKPNDDHSSIRDSRLLEGKVVLSTFHQFKGRERKMVILVGFDSGFYICNKEAPRESCPNLLYVAATRASQYLILIEHATSGVLPFLRLDQLTESADLIGPFPGDPQKLWIAKSKTYSVNDLVKFLPHSFLEEIRPYWSVTSEHPGTTGTEIDSIVQFGNISEDVSPIYGTSVPVIKQYLLQKSFAIFKTLAKFRGYAKDLTLEDEMNFAMSLGSKMAQGQALNWDQLAWVINLANCVIDRYIHPLRQIKEYSWFLANMAKIAECVERLNFLGVNDHFEEPTFYKTKIKGTSVEVLGVIDCIQQSGQPWEFKLVREFKEEHVIQTVIYGCMQYLQNGKSTPFKLFNSRTGETWVIKINTIEINASRILNRILEHKVRSGDNRKTLPDLMSSVA